MENSPEEWHKAYKKILIWCSGQTNICLH